MSSAGFRIASLIGLAEMIALPNDPAQFYVTLGIAITTAGGVILQFLKNKQDRVRIAADRQERLDHQEELRSRVEAMKIEIMANTGRRAGELKREILANTVLTQQGIEKTEAFAETANHVSEKFATLASLAAAGIAPLAVDTNETVHRIEENAL